jgi:hypothetical protein
VNAFAEGNAGVALEGMQSTIHRRGWNKDIFGRLKAFCRETAVLEPWLRNKKRGSPTMTVDDSARAGQSGRASRSCLGRASARVHGCHAKCIIKLTVSRKPPSIRALDFQLYAAVE